MGNYLEILKSEFDSEEASFLLLLYVHNEWNKNAFTRLTNAMKECCEAHEGQAPVERWLAEGFWLVYTTTEGILQQPAFRAIHDPEYYRKAKARLSDLGYWFFFGRSPFIEGSVIEPV